MTKGDWCCCQHTFVMTRDPYFKLIEKAFKDLGATVRDRGFVPSRWRRAREGRADFADEIRRRWLGLQLTETRPRFLRK